MLIKHKLILINKEIVHKRKINLSEQRISLHISKHHTSQNT